MTKQVLINRTHCQLIHFTSLHIHQNESLIVSWNHKWTLTHIKVCYFGKSPTPDVGFCRNWVRQDSLDYFLVVIYKNEFVIVPTNGKELVIIILKDFVDKLFSLIAYFLQD
jgi:hypothetical protein